jgi:hypothetical protein
MVEGLGFLRSSSAEGIEDPDVVREGDLREVNRADRDQ